jgi:hypothetical protein
MRLNAGTVLSPATRRISLAPPLRLIGLTALLLHRGSGTVEHVTDRDANLARTTGLRVTDYQMSLESLGGLGSFPIAWTSSHPTVATVDAYGYVSYVSDGAAVITATTAGQSVSVLIALAGASGFTTDDLVSYVAGSLAAAATEAVDSRLAGKSPSTALQIFTTQDHAGGVYVRNAACWAADLDLTCISPWNSVDGPRRAGTLISLRHVLFAAHYPAVKGMTMRFVAPDNAVVTRTVSEVLTHPSYIPYFPDIQIGLLDSDVPADIGFARVLPPTWEVNLPARSIARSLPCLCLDQEEKALVSDLASIFSDYSVFTAPFRINSEIREGFHESKVGGDSGNPAFIILGGQLVLLTVWTYGGAGRGTSISPQIAAINAMMTALGGGYQLTEVDLSGFPTYAP